MSLFPLEFPPGLTERFWAKVCIGPKDECWEWTASRLKNGYGHIGVGGKTEYAHRLSYKIHKGSVPAGLDVCHSCDNRACVNPDHLWIGTRAENMADCATKGRARGPNYKGSEVGTSKLVEMDVVLIKAALLKGASPSDLGRKYGVSRSAISMIKRGKSWAHIKGTPCHCSL